MRWLFALGVCLLSSQALAVGNRTLRFVPYVPPVLVAPINTAFPEVVGLDFPPSPGGLITMAVNKGTWSNSPLSYSCFWHKPDGTSLGGNCSGLTLNASTGGVLGTVVEVDVTASNLGGSTIAKSYWFGPLENAAPTAPVAQECTAMSAGNCTAGNLTPTSLPVAPAHFLQNGFAIYPGCVIPPVSPPFTSGAHVWYFDPINGRTQDAGAVGSAADPFNNIQAIFSSGISGYTGGKLFARTIAVGDTIYIRPGDATHPLGSLISNSSAYSTSTGLTGGTVNFTWILPDPAASGPVVLNQINFGLFGTAGLIFGDFRLEPLAGTLPSVFIQGNTSNLSHDIIVRGVNVSNWSGHANDSWLPSHYPSSNGSSNGQLDTAAPVMYPTLENLVSSNVTAPLNSLTLTLNSGFALTPGYFIWSPGYYLGNAQQPQAPSTGIPNGTVVKSVAGSTITIGPCDPVTDAANGCPAGPIPGCDPKVAPLGLLGCNGASPPYQGTTRALTAENIVVTSAMQVLPAGYFNHTDWAAAAAGGAVTAFNFGGSVNSAGSVDPVNANLFQGMTCVSIKDSIAREAGNGLVFSRMTNSIAFNNFFKWFSQDAMDFFSVHRNWVIHNYISDPALIWNHQDGIQISINGSTPPTRFYGNAAVDNELYDFTDPTNYFPRIMQGIMNTDSTHMNQYVANNVLATGTNGILTGGYWNVVVNNTVATKPLSVVATNKVSTSTIPTNSLNANNLSSGNIRNTNYPSVFASTSCDPSTGSKDIVQTNVSIPFIPPSAGPSSNVFCPSAVVPPLSNHTQGAYLGLEVTSGIDWTNGPGGLGLFRSYWPNAAPISPAPGSTGFAGLSSYIHYCIQNSFFPTGDSSVCPAGQGVSNVRPNAAFAGTNQVMSGNAVNFGALPQGLPDGTFYVVTSVLVGQQGVWESCSTAGAVICTGTIITNGTSKWMIVSPYFAPSLVAQGTALGAQAPITDHEGKKWATIPAIGAYEVGP